MNLQNQQALPAGEWLTLHDVDWPTYRAMRDDPANLRLRMTFDRGELSIMSPGRLHERIAELMGNFITEWAVRHRIPISSGGALTVSREDLQRGCEPDKCYFIRHEAQVTGSDEYSLDEGDPPPDLVVEVDVTSSSVPRMPIYAAMGVPEVWRWRNEVLEVFTLGADGEYQAQEASQALLGFPLDEVVRLLGRRRRENVSDLVWQFRQFLQG